MPEPEDQPSETSIKADPREVGVVMIGRNEGERLLRCLQSVRGQPMRVYVDSGSTDGSVARARAEGAVVVELPVPPKFTAARARNAGIEALLLTYPDLRFVQVVDGDCEVQPGWIATALPVMESEPDLAGVFGRRRERFPERSVYNVLCDDEWNVPVGEAACFGGDVLLRVEAIRAAEGYDDMMIAGEDPDFSSRMRKLGWRIRRIDAEMTLHDAAILKIGQWWIRARRAGHAFAELAERHPEADWKQSCSSIVLWGAVLPGVLATLIVLALFVPMLWPLPLLMLCLWPLQILRIGMRQRHRFSSMRLALASGFYLMLGKFPELQGLRQYKRNRRTGRSSVLIEYKGTA